MTYKLFFYKMYYVKNKQRSKCRNQNFFSIPKSFLLLTYLLYSKVGGIFDDPWVQIVT